jgi:hypothetical protein
MADIAISSKYNIRVANTEGLVTRQAKLGEVASVGHLVYLKTDGLLWLADASALATLPGVGIIISLPDGKVDGAVGDNAEVLVQGFVAGFTVTVIGGIVYASDTAGGVADAVGTKAQRVGQSWNDSIIFIRPEFLAV